MVFSKANKTINRFRCMAVRNVGMFVLILPGFAPICANAQTAADLLSQADHFAHQGDWYDAGPLYAKAEAEFRRTGDNRNELYAKFGRLHRDVESGSYRTVRAEVVKALGSPAVQVDPLLRIRGLALLGSIDLNIDTAAAVNDWNQVLSIAKTINDQKWDNRAKGELALIAGANGNLGSAGVALYAAMAKAEQLGDVAGYVSFATWLTNGMAVNGMADRALTVIDRAGDFAKKNGYPEIPLQLSIARIRALMNLPEAQAEQSRDLVNRLVTDTLAEAQKQHVLGAQTELLNDAGQIAMGRNDLLSAEKAFRQAVEVSKTAGLPREDAEAYLHLSQFYRATNQPAKASEAIDEGIHAVQRVEEGYDLPLFIAEKAEVEDALGSIHAADASFQRATDLVEGLLVNAPTSQVKSAMIGALSKIYLAHFRLAWNRVHDASYAFTIIENARGRALRDSIQYARQNGAAPESQTRGETEITRLQRSLMHDQLNNAQTRRVLDQLDAAYVKMNSVEYVRQRKEMGLGRTRPVSAATLQTQLRPHETLVEFVLDTKASYAIEISRTNLKIQPLPFTSGDQQTVSFVRHCDSQRGRVQGQRTGAL